MRYPEASFDLMLMRGFLVFFDEQANAGDFKGLIF